MTSTIYPCYDTRGWNTFENSEDYNNNSKSSHLPTEFSLRLHSYVTLCAMDILRKAKRQVGPGLTHCSLHSPNLHSRCDSGFDLADDPTPMLLGHEYYPFSATLPVPLGSPASVDNSVLNGIDPAFDLVYKKYKYKQKYEALIQKCRDVRLPKDVEKVLKNMSDSHKMKVHPNIASLAKLISQDPHPHFNGGYNSYYGNTVTVCTVQDNDFIIYPIPYSLKKLNVVHPNYGKESCSIDKEYCVDHGMDNSQPIYQIQSSGDIVLLRLSNKCALLKLSPVDDSVFMQLLYSNENKDPFITSCLNPYTNEYATFAPDALIKIHDINNGCINRELNLNFLGNEDFWGSVHYQDENVIMFCDHKTINLLDLRTPINRSTVLQWDVNSPTEKCDSIYSSTKGAYLHYVCTNHYLLSLDIREGWYQRWTHGLTNAPSVLSLVSKEINDSLLIGCQMGGSIVNVYNAHSTDFNFEFIKAPPFQLPSLIETLHQARLKGHCLLPLINSHFSMSLTGLSAVRNACNVDVFLCNSIGDIFSQRINLLDKIELFTPELNEPEIECLHAWESKYSQHHLNKTSETVASSIHSCRKYHQFFDYSQSSIDCDGFESVVKTETIQPWAWTKRDLESCCDMLAPQLLSCWKLEEDDEEWSYNFNAKPKIGQDFDSESSDDSMEDVYQRIEDWLKQSVQSGLTQ